MTVLGIAGWSGSGKTTLIEKLLPALTARGMTVSTLKRTHHDVDLDRPGKDSFRHRVAGAQEVMIASAARFALLRETPGGASLDSLLARMAPVDLVLVEGFKLDAMPKLEVFRASLGQPRLWPGTPGIVAVASDTPTGGPLPWFDLDDVTVLADWVSRQARLGEQCLPPQTPNLS